MALLVVPLVLGCQSYADRTPRTFLEGDNAGNYERVFAEEPSPDIEIVNSVVVDYAWRLGVVTTDDWEFEILAPRAWIDRHLESLHLRGAETSPSVDAILAEVESGKPIPMRIYHWRMLYDRKLHPIRSWYVPNDLRTYDAYYLSATSVPYVHMLVEPEAGADGRHRVFISKH